MPDLLGAHMSIAGGLALALERGREVGCSVVQIFLKNQRQWAARPYTDSEVREFRAAWKATGIRMVFAHANYGPPQRECRTPFRGQPGRIGHSEQRGETGRQMFWPKETSRSL